MEGVLYFSNEAPHVAGYLTIGEHCYEIVGVKRTDVRADVTVREIGPEETREKMQELMVGRYDRSGQRKG